MKSAAVFIAGVCIGAWLTQAATAQDARPRGLNHVGIAVKNYDATIDFYKRAMGFREAYRLTRPDGGPLLTYLQISRDTFLEVQPSNANLPPGLTHFAIEYGDIRAEVARLRQAGVAAADPGVTPGKALFTRMGDLDGVPIEVMEFGPDSAQRKAMDAWK